MIIDEYGNIPIGLNWSEGNGPAIKHFSEKHNMPFTIGVYYKDEEQKEKHRQMCILKKNLSDSDWRAAKYADGGYTEEEYAPYRAQREAWRVAIREIEQYFIDHPEPTLTEEQVLQAEDIAMEKSRRIQQEEAQIIL